VRLGAKLALALLLAPLAGRSAAQAPLDWTWHLGPAPQSQTNFAGDMLVVDLDGDGFEDLVASQRGATVSGVIEAGRAWVLFGPTFEPGIELQAATPTLDEEFSSGGFSAGDVDGDGHLDLLVGSPNWMDAGSLRVGRAHLFHGPDFATSTVYDDPVPQAEAQFGRSVLLADVTGDGRADVIVGAPFGTAHGLPLTSGKVVAWDTASPAPPATLVSHEPKTGARYGSTLDAAHMNGDSILDLLVGADNHLTTGATLNGRNFVHAGPSLDWLMTLAPTQLGTSRYGDVAYAGDLTGDGEQDLLITAYGTFNTELGLDCRGAVFLLEGPSYANVSHVFTPVPEDCDGSDDFGERTIVTDVDRDGVPDVLITQLGSLAQESRVQVFYGPDWMTVQSLGDFGTPVLGFGFELESGDVDGDGADELLVFASQFSLSGSLALFDLQTLQSDVTAVSISAGADVTWSLDMGAEHAGEFYLAALGISGEWPGTVVGPGSWVPLNVDAITEIGLSLAGTPALPNWLGVLDGQGQAQFELQFGPGGFSALIGQELTVAAVTALPDGTLGAGSSGATFPIDP
jgi:hypothetical protein